VNHCKIIVNYAVLFSLYRFNVLLHVMLLSVPGQHLEPRYTNLYCNCNCNQNVSFGQTVILSLVASPDKYNIIVDIYLRARYSWFGGIKHILSVENLLQQSKEVLLLWTPRLTWCKSRKVRPVEEEKLSAMLL